MVRARTPVGTSEALTPSHLFLVFSKMLFRYKTAATVRKADVGGSSPSLLKRKASRKDNCLLELQLEKSLIKRKFEKTTTISLHSFFTYCDLIGVVVVQYPTTMKNFPSHQPIKYGVKIKDTPADDHVPPPIPSSIVSSSKEEDDIGHFYRSYDNRLWMFYRYWKPPSTTKIIASLMIVHGTVDHSGVYQELADYLTQSGIAVIAMDMRGWGLSDGESMYFHDIETFCHDAYYLSDLVHKSDEHGLKQLDPTKRFLLGKSIGGLITAFCVGKYYPTHWMGGLIGLSGAYQLDPKLGRPSFLQRVILHNILSYMPKLPFKPLFDPNLIVADEQALQEWKDDPLCCKDKLRVGYAIEILRATSIMAQDDDDEKDENIKIAVPLLILIGDDDHVVSGHQLLLDKVQNMDDAGLNVYPKGRHNLLQEPSLKDQVMNDIRSWILNHV